MKRLKDFLNEHILTYQEFIDRTEQRNADQVSKDRRQHLAGIKKTQYAIKFTFENDEQIGLLLEHEQYKKFAKSSNRYTYHPENANIPVKAHYHVFPSNSKKELYAVNVDDGSAHHKSNRGYVVPKKEADELSILGVKFKAGNILENLNYQLNESLQDDLLTIYIIVDE
jgi:hypothetical protein